MQALNQFIGSLFKAAHHPAVETDDVFPLHFLDNLHTGRVIVLSETLRFDQVLDAEKLCEGLAKLLQQGDWRKLGGRLRSRPDGYIEVHVPKEFTEQRPPAHFSTEVFNISIAEHDLGSQLPKATGGPSIQPGPTSFGHFNTRPDGPLTLQDYICSDRPILSLQVTSFTDATIVTVVWPHAVTGALGFKEILSAWSRALRDESSIPPLLGARKDILDRAGTESDAHAPYSLASNEIKGWGFVKFVSRMLWNVFWRPTVDSRALCLPRHFMSQLRMKSLKELEDIHGADNVPFLSEGDVLTAWAARFVARNRGRTCPGLIFNPLDITSRLELDWKTEGVYVQNLVGAMYTTVDADVLLNKSLGELAHAIRLSIQQQATDEQIRAQLRIFRSLGHEKSEPLYGDSDSQLIAFSNWTKFDLFNAVDFSPAVSKASSPIRSGVPLGKPTYMHCASLGENRFQRNCFAITGKDLDGNYWISAFLYPEDWEGLNDYMQQTWQDIK
ncbi:hypothetical protein B0J13DRAFT_509917 [Dactylonectria estremocensis]|uniref:Uncharacterized protein n=1 Tax=Dactylonectria estremocensis TaxID=1079267 RepID=A0A9P9DZS9_9HYPO|nr:hypothetical protein B0J13DRAFT_509917 [Dactylonectria estremocensis]